MWRPIQSAPFDTEVELAVIDHQGVHALIFPCRRQIGFWQDQRGLPVLVHPTHWRYWTGELAAETEPIKPDQTTEQTS